MSKSEIPDITDIIESVNKKNDNDNFNNSNNSNSSNMDNIEYMQKLEIGKIIVQETLKNDNIQSLSFLNNDQIDDIVKARLLNTYYNIPEINDYINDFLELKRSQEGQLIKLFTKMVMFNNQIDEDKKGLFSRILKR